MIYVWRFIGHHLGIEEARGRPLPPRATDNGILV